MMTVAIRKSPKEMGLRFPAGPETATATGQTTITRVDRKQAGESLPALLDRIGITGRAYETLIGQEELLDDPSPALAWWWVALTQEGVQRPARLVVHALATNYPPRFPFLELARTWPQVTAGHRSQIEETLLSGISCEELAARWSDRYPGLTASACYAFMMLYAIAPWELGYPRAKGAWGQVFEI